MGVSSSRHGLCHEVAGAKEGGLTTNDQIRANDEKRTKDVEGSKKDGGEHTAADEAVKEQDRQLEEGTESPG